MSQAAKQQSYQSISTPDVNHNAPNMITELILLNQDLHVGPYPWRGEHKVFWGKTVATVRKLIRDFKISEDQLAFYVHKCKPVEINGEEFGKAAVVARKLFQRYDLIGLVESYRRRRSEASVSRLDTAKISKPQTTPTKPKSLLDFLKELEDGTKEEGSGGINGGNE